MLPRRERAWRGPGDRLHGGMAGCWGGWSCVGAEMRLEQRSHPVGTASDESHARRLQIDLVRTVS